MEEGWKKSRGDKHLSFIHNLQPPMKILNFCKSINSFLMTISNHKLETTVFITQTVTLRFDVTVVKI